MRAEGGRDARRRTKIAVQRLSCTLTMSGGGGAVAAGGDRCDAEVRARAHSPVSRWQARSLCSAPFLFPRPRSIPKEAWPGLRVEKLRFTRTLIAGEKKQRAGRERGRAGGHYFTVEKELYPHAEAKERVRQGGHPPARRLAPGPSPLSTARSEL